MTHQIINRLQVDVWFRREHPRAAWVIAADADGQPGPYGALHLGPCYNLTANQLTTWLHAFIDRIQAKVGRPPMSAPPWRE